MLRIDRHTVIYVLCPSRIVTGGIEAVHQLVDKLRRFGHRAFIVPVPAVNNPVLLQYRHYDASFIHKVVDHSDNVLIATEVNPTGLDAYQHIQKALWWLSVDFHETLSRQFDFSARRSRPVAHFVQSAYAYSFLKQKGVADIFYLTDYLNEIYLRRDRAERKHQRVLYTPVKGATAYIQRLIEADPSIQWMALAGLLRREHARAMRQGKVYVDFGSHPGKDRQPREAVVNGCCVLVGLAGAACNAEDIPIPEGYKFDLGQLDVEAILSTIRSCLQDHGRRYQDFEAYAEIVRQDEQRFEREVRQIFGQQAIKNTLRPWIVVVNILAFARQNNVYIVLRGLVNEWVPLSVLRWIKARYRLWRGPRS
ncbi:MAG: hypothetical protein ACK5QW_08585 [Cyanobacteriota bacterium]|jgi:hypothetical protein